MEIIMKTTLNKKSLTAALLCFSSLSTAALAQDVNRASPRADGGTITLSGANARSAGNTGVALTRNISANLPKRLDSYTLSDIEAAVEKANATTPGAANARLTVQVCWSGKRRNWCIGLSSSPQ
jgi:type 1 fimbria pilin